MCTQIPKDALTERLRWVKPIVNKEMKLREISNLLEKPIIGVIPEDNHVRESVMIRDAVIHLKPRSKASVNYKKTAAKLIGQEYKEPGFFANLFSSSKKN